MSKVRGSSDPIGSICCSEILLLVARKSGEIRQYSMPHFHLERTYNIGIDVVQMDLNISSTFLSLIDVKGVLRLLQLEVIEKVISKGLVAASDESFSEVPQQHASGSLLQFERKDVWNICWSKDDTDRFAVMEKTKLIVYRALIAEETLSAVGYICDFKDSVIHCADFDSLIRAMDMPSKEMTSKIETKILKELRGIIGLKGFDEAIRFAMQNVAGSLWSLIAIQALRCLNLDVAQNAFIQLKDYNALQFIKRLNKLDDPMKKKAEVCAYILEFDEAERLYLDIDRKDLAINVRIRIGDWQRVVQLIEAGGVGDDKMLEMAWNQIGDYHFERQEWLKATTYYSKAQNIPRLVESYCILEDYEAVENLVIGLSDSNPYISLIAARFVDIGLYEQALNVYLRLGNISEAIDTCVILNNWGTAIELAEKHHHHKLESLLDDYGEHISKQKGKKEAIILYRKANYNHRAAQLLFNLGSDLAKAMGGLEDAIKIKRFYVLGAIELYRSVGTRQLNYHHKLAKESPESKDGFKSLEKPWRGAEAYHFFILAQKQFYAGKLVEALITSSFLHQYDDFLQASVVDSLIALVSLHAGFYATCSRAMLKLEALKDANLDYYRRLAFDIFSKNKPRDPDLDTYSCSNCLESMKARYKMFNSSESTCNACHLEHPICTASGKPIISQQSYSCHGCKHKAIESEIIKFTHCPLCHTIL